jgi:hypothetical protein
MKLGEIALPPNVASYKIDRAVCRRGFLQIEDDDFLASSDQGGSHVRSGKPCTPRDDVPHQAMPSG